MAPLNVTGVGSGMDANSPLIKSFDATSVQTHVFAARCICHAVVVALAAQEDGSVLFDDGEASRWGPSIDFARERLLAIREQFLESARAPNCDWWTALNLLEALGAANWHDQGGGGDGIDHCEMAALLGVVIESLDSLSAEIDAAEIDAAEIDAAESVGAGHGQH